MKELPKGFIIDILKKFKVKYFIFGSTIKVKCPFHNDKNPSASVSVEKNTFICFACKDSLYKRLNKDQKNKIAISAYNLFKLLGGTDKEWQNLVKEAFKNPDKYKKLITQIEKEKSIKKNTGLIEIWNSLEDIPDKESLNYLNERKINFKKVKNEIKFISEESKFNKWKIALPVYNVEKNLVGIQLRASNDKTTPKTIMIPGSSLGFLGLNNLKDSRITVLVEGSIDYLTAKSIGLKRVIGITSASQTIPEELSEYFTKTAIFFVHNDPAGINLYKKVKDICKDKNIILKGVRISKKPGGDLNDFVSNHKNFKVKLKNYLIKLLKGEKNESRNFY